MPLGVIGIPPSRPVLPPRPRRTGRFAVPGVAARTARQLKDDAPRVRHHAGMLLVEVFLKPAVVLEPPKRRVREEEELPAPCDQGLQMGDRGGTVRWVV